MALLGDWAVSQWHRPPGTSAGGWARRACKPGRLQTQDLLSLVCTLLRLLVTAWPGAAASFTPAEMNCSLSSHDGHPSLRQVHLMRHFHSYHRDGAAGLCLQLTLPSSYVLRERTLPQALIQHIFGFVYPDSAMFYVFVKSSVF